MVVSKRGSWGRSVRAVFAGIATNFVIALVLDLVLHTLGVFPVEGRITDPQAGIAFSYRLIAAFAGGYITARAAPNRPMRHAVILGCIGVALSTLGLIMMGDRGPLWYPAALIVISLPASIAGAQVYLRE